MNDAASLFARFASHADASGHAVTQLADASWHAPLKLAKTFQNEHGLSACIMDASPGLLAGDSYKLKFQLDANARVQLSNQGFARVHPSRERFATLTQHVSIASGAWCELFFEPTLLYRDAFLRAQTTIEVQRGGTLLLGEFWGAGRIARSEAWQFFGLDTRFSATYNQQLAFVSNTRLRPQEQNPRQIGAFGDATHWGTVLCISERADADLRDAWREVLHDFPVQSGASLTAHGGVAALLMGTRAYDLQAAGEALREVTRKVSDK